MEDEEREGNGKGVGTLKHKNVGVTGEIKEGRKVGRRTRTRRSRDTKA